jgi:hypothetical protein
MSSSSDQSTSAKAKGSFHGRKLQYQQRIVEHTAVTLPATAPLVATYLTAETGWKLSSTIVPARFADRQKKQVEK